MILFFFISTSVSLGYYETDFSKPDKHWEIAKNKCSHCKKRNGDECTLNTPEAVHFGKDGMTITTTRLSEQTSCGGLATSGHAEFKDVVLYGDFTIVAKFFPGPESVVRSATAFIGWDSDKNQASITFGFHGKGWDGEPNWDQKFQCARYATNGEQSHERKIFDTKQSLADYFTTYRMVWTPDRIAWFVDGVLYREETDPTVIPSIPMKPRLHLRSGWQSQMSESDTFYGTFKFFSYTPYKKKKHKHHTLMRSNFSVQENGTQWIWYVAIFGASLLLGCSVGFFAPKLTNLLGNTGKHSETLLNGE